MLRGDGQTEHALTIHGDRATTVLVFVNNEQVGEAILSSGGTSTAVTFTLESDLNIIKIQTTGAFMFRGAELITTHSAETSLRRLHSRLRAS